MKTSVKIDTLIEIVRKGGIAKTGINVYNKRGVLLIEKDVLIKSINALLTLKNNGLTEVPVDYENAGGLWDRSGRAIKAKGFDQHAPERKPVRPKENKRLEEIINLKAEAKLFHQRAQKKVKKIIEEVKKTGGGFDQTVVASMVDDLFVFLATKGNAFTFLAKELFSYDEYLYNHSVNVCTLGTAVLLHFNEHFGDVINRQLSQAFISSSKLDVAETATSYILYYPDELKEIAMGMFLHDIGKVLISEDVMNKTGALTKEERTLVNSHSHEFGNRILEKNEIHNAFIKNVVRYHHCAIYKDEKLSYPAEKLPIEIPPYVKICKMVDMYDSLTSKRSYKDAESPATAVTNIFRRYAGKEDIMLQLLLHSFVKVVGIYPCGSVVYLRNGQIAYVIDSEGPICIPFTDKSGKSVLKQQEPIDISTMGDENNGFIIDRRKPPLLPKDTYRILPEYLKNM